MKISLNSRKIKKIINPTLILIVLFLSLVAFEAYQLYYKVYGNLSTRIDDITVDVNIVRLDVGSYNKMIELLDARTGFKPQNPVYENPFQ